MPANRVDESVNSLPVLRKQKKRGNVRFHEEFFGLGFHTSDENVMSRFLLWNQNLMHQLAVRCLSQDESWANCNICMSVCAFSAAQRHSDHQVWTLVQFSDRKSCFHRLRQERAVGNSKRFIVRLHCSLNC